MRNAFCVTKASCGLKKPEEALKCLTKSEVSHSYEEQAEEKRRENIKAQAWPSGILM